MVGFLTNTKFRQFSLSHHLSIVTSYKKWLENTGLSDGKDANERCDFMCKWFVSCLSLFLCVVDIFPNKIKTNDMFTQRMQLSEL